MFRPVLFLALLSRLTPAQPVEVRAVIVTMFERGADTGDEPGELQFWVERENLSRTLPFPAGHRPLRANAEGTVLAVVTGPGVANAAATVMALGSDPRFNLRKAYWLVAGIAGVDPEDASLGSAAWARFVLDGDLAYEIDSREAPAAWPYGLLALGAKEPNSLSVRRTSTGDFVAFTLNAKLAEWAYALTRDAKLPDNEEMRRYRAAYKDSPAAQRPPFVLIGDSMGSSTFWHGERLTRWANDWARLWTKGQANFVMTNMEDNGTAASLQRLHQAGKADFSRLLVLRTGSNYCRQAPGQPAIASLTTPYSALIPSLESAWIVGSRVVHELLANWPRYSTEVPGSIP